MILETERLYLREMKQSDYSALAKMLQDKDVMYAYEGPFNDEETQGWLDHQLSRYKECGYGLWAVVLKETDTMIGQCGLSNHKWKDQEILEVGYLFQTAYWHHGYCSEAAIACREYAFTKLNAKEVYSMIRNTNTASINVAKRNGMSLVDTWTKHYRGVDMPHVLYCVKNNECN